MSGVDMTLEPRVRVPLIQRPAALAAALAGRLLATASPSRLRKLLQLAARGATPATAEQALRARRAVVAVSIACAGPRCLQRSIATALLCRLRGTWPQWRTGVVTEPFAAHAWVALDRQPIGEDPDMVKHFHVVMSVDS
ncbi:lasso peptide biosynthesis B2 protein [Saccharothrix sp. AJ9571]|nr:lasso peptide biosynthesis B2 protein [Saccharothrix sp. AJ9571]